MHDFTSILDTLRKEEHQLEAQLAKIRAAMSALADNAADQVTTATQVAKKARKMTAAQKQFISERMKQYWAARKRKAA